MKLQTEHLSALSSLTKAPPLRPTDDLRGDVGGQKTLRTYWKNYFEKTDTLIWVVDATDRERLDDCRQELKGLLVQEVFPSCPSRAVAAKGLPLTTFPRLMGASLLVFKNKSDVPGCMSEDEIQQVRFAPHGHNSTKSSILPKRGQGLHLDNIRTHRWHILPCSAMTGQNLQEGLSWVVQDAKDRLFLY